EVTRWHFGIRGLANDHVHQGTGAADRQPRADDDAEARPWDLAGGRRSNRESWALPREDVPVENPPGEGAPIHREHPRSVQRDTSGSVRGRAAGRTRVQRPRKREGERRGEPRVSGWDEFPDRTHPEPRSI